MKNNEFHSPSKVLSLKKVYNICMSDIFLYATLFIIFFLYFETKHNTKIYQIFVAGFDTDVFKKCQNCGELCAAGRYY